MKVVFDKMSSDPKTHHVRHELCTTRAPYRQGRQLKAVKVYTVAQESRYLLILGAPSVGAHKELIQLLALYGTIEEYRPLDEYPAEEHTDVFWVKFQKIQAARMAKRKLDDYNFFGGTLHVCYAPEYETVQDTREKLQDRRRTIAYRIRKLDEEKGEKNKGRVATTDVPHTAHQPPPEEVSVQDKPAEAVADGSSEGRDRIPPLPVPFNPHLPPPSFPSMMHKHFPPPMSMPPPGFVPHSIEGQNVTNAQQLNPHLLLPPPPPFDPHNPGLVKGKSQHDVMHKHYSQLQGSPLPHPNMPQTSHTSAQSTSSSNKTLTQQPGDKKPPEKRMKVESKQGVESVIVKECPTASKTLVKFVPRQVAKRQPVVHKTGPLPTKPAVVDVVNEELRMNARVLGDKAGPQLPKEEEEKRTLFTHSETGDQSLDKTAAAIREQVKQFAAIAQPRQLKRKRKRKHSSSNSNEASVKLKKN